MRINKALSLFVLLAIQAVIWSGSAIAQDDAEEQTSIFLVATFYVDVPEDGSVDELLGLLEEQNEATKDNPKVLSSLTLRHYFSADSREIVMITEYESLQAMEEAFEIGQQLIEAKWPDKEEREARASKIGSYIEYHSDAIYSNVPGLRR